eukprot:m.184212 g.184212  ORF g.184212 m.184212 type:complete len:77 (+) comp24686_c0_seq1:138-368(+)
MHSPHSHPTPHTTLTQARIDNAENREKTCAVLKDVIGACRLLAIEQGRLKPGTQVNVGGSEYDSRHRVWVDAGRPT